MDVLSSTARFKVLSCGRRWGKTRLGGYLCVKHAIKGKRIWWVAPSYKMAAVGWRVVRQLSQQIPGVNIREADRIVEFPNGGTVQVRSADDPQSLRGDGLDGVVLDECAFMREEAWTEALRPALSDRKGWAFFISTPKGYNWFHDLWRRAEYDPDWQSWRKPTIDNPFIDPAEIESAQQSIPEVIFRQEYQAEFLENIGGLFDATKIEIVDYVPECKQVVRFYDLAVTAKKTSDYTVGLKLGITADERPVILDVWRGQRELPDVQEAIVQNAQMDSTSVPLRLEAEKAGIVQLQFLLRDPRMRSFVIDAKAPEGDKFTRAAPIAARVNAGRVLMVRAAWNRALLDELAVFPQGEHDDQVDALSGAYSMVADGVKKWRAGTW